MNINELGFVFELGFNIGVASCLEDDIKESIKIYLEDRCYIRDKVYASFTKEIVDEVEREVIRKNIDYLLFKGLSCGKNYFKEWIDAKVGNKSYKVEYFQANFFKIFDDKKRKLDEQDYYIKLLKRQLNIDLTEEEVSYLFKKGQAFRADTIILVSVRKKYYLCVVDNAIGMSNIVNYTDLERLKELFNRAIFQKRSKGSFSNLAVDSSDVTDMNIDKCLGDYILGLGKKDKPLFKMIQAGSYANSFIKLLLNKGILELKSIESICIVGYTDEEICSSNLNYNQLDILAMCEDTYREADRQNVSTDLIDKRQEVFSRIRTNFKRFFEVDGETLKSLMNLKLGINIVEFSECYDDYQNTAQEKFEHNNVVDTFRNTHAKQIEKYIGDKNIDLLFLTGNPGIGKTTAIVEYLKEEDGYIFLYLSPRTQVNQDIEDKFTKDAKLYDDEMVYLTANGNDEKKIKGAAVNVVNFRANNEGEYTSIVKPITFLPNSRERNYEEQSTEFKNINNTLYKQVEEHSAGVLNRLTKAINYVIANQKSNKIIATVAIQSLKVIGHKKTTAEHFKKIFDTIYNEKTDTVNIEAFTHFAKRYPNVILMVDEITGDESGAAFLEELINLVFNKIHRKLPTYLKEKVNFKIVVADASITNIEVIQKHLKSNSTDSDKVYFKKQKQTERESLSIESFKFKDKYNAISINTNSYPAKKLHIDYKLYLNMKRVSQTKDIFSKDVITNVNEQMAIEAVGLLHNKKAEQVIIYIQDIARLEDIEKKIIEQYRTCNKDEIVKGKDYIIINSTLSDSQRKEVLKAKKYAKIVLMTSSASRGLSFPNTTVLLVDIPKFDIEKNIMEILQLIYRGRGDENKDRNEEKYLKFYIGDTICCKELGDVQSVQNHLISLFTLLIVLKASILTRIYGGCNISKQNISLVPVGGKGIGATSDMLIESFSSLIKNLQKEHYKDRSNKSISDLIEELKVVFGNSVIETQGEVYNNCRMKNIKQMFYNSWNEGIYKLMEFEPFKNPMILGDIMIFKLDKEVGSLLNFQRDLVGNILNNGDLIRNMLGKAYKDPSLSQQLRGELRKAGETLKYFRKNNSKVSMSLKDTTQAADRFVAIPLVAPFVYDEFESYIDIEESNTFKDILQSYIRAYYSIGDVLPISDNYEDVPFITFRSASLKNMRNRIYNNRYMFCSSELNLLNLLLVHE